MLRIIVLAAAALSSRGDSHLATEEVGAYHVSCHCYIVISSCVIIVSYHHCNNLIASYSYPIYRLVIVPYKDVIHSLNKHV